MADDGHFFSLKGGGGGGGGANLWGGGGGGGGGQIYGGCWKFYDPIMPMEGSHMHFPVI